jgi:TetR/AcrR family transcriptional regulator, transcriptional repressor for nem operon
VICLDLFVVIELEIDEPLLDARLFAVWTFGNALILLTVLMVGLYAVLLYIPQFLQIGHDVHLHRRAGRCRSPSDTAVANLVSEMTNSTALGRSHKRELLVTSATDLMHRHGVLATTLADVAQASGVPLGGVYYYFKTKDDLIRAVLDTRATQIQAMVNNLDALPTPATRLKALVHSWAQTPEVINRHGCPVGSLAAELDKREDGLATEAANLIELILGWAQRQFQQMGRPDDRDLAITLFARVQGAALLTMALRDPQIMTSQARHIQDWIDSLA